MKISAHDATRLLIVLANLKYGRCDLVFSGVADCGRKVEIDMHAKGMDDTMMELAVNAGPPIRISHKYWGEHFGMPCHQADIRERAPTASGARTVARGDF
jgi:hypothetical protein